MQGKPAVAQTLCCMETVTNLCERRGSNLQRLQFLAGWVLSKAFSDIGWNRKR